MDFLFGKLLAKSGFVLENRKPARGKSRRFLARFEGLESRRLMTAVPADAPANYSVVQLPLEVSPLPSAPPSTVFSPSNYPVAQLPLEVSLLPPAPSPPVLSPPPLEVIDHTYSSTAPGFSVFTAEGLLALNYGDWGPSPYTAVELTGPSHGALQVNADGSFVYTPNAGFTGTDTFTFEATDGTRDSNIGTVTLDVLPQSNSSGPTPFSSDHAYQAPANNLLNVDATHGVLSLQEPLGGIQYWPAPQQATAELVTGPAHGTLTLNSDGSFSYQPDAGFTGVDTFSFEALVGSSVSRPASVTLHVVASPTAPAPVAFDHYYDLDTDRSTNLRVGANQNGLLAYSTDANLPSVWFEGQTLPLTASLVSGPTHGVLTVNADGSFNYTPNAGFTGADTFTYKLNDGRGDSNVATVTISVYGSDTAKQPMAPPLAPPLAPIILIIPSVENSSSPYIATPATATIPPHNASTHHNTSIPTDKIAAPLATPLASPDTAPVVAPTTNLIAASEQKKAAQDHPSEAGSRSLLMMFFGRK
jgi:VCBS repeat-containing protein